jgi:2-polyprenyl-3-methyl-5-hydroxy-6-metoxy-1,4-benzoquinol methylase
MAEHRLPGWGSVNTFEFHEHRERAPHLEQPDHRHRLLAARELLTHAIAEIDDADVPLLDEQITVTDLGCGDGGFLQLIEDLNVQAWGYDFQPSNQHGWFERGVIAYAHDWTNHTLGVGDVVILTEVLEHLYSPHGQLRWLYEETLALCVVASSPLFENQENAADCHAWAWDWDGYEKLFKDAGWRIECHRQSHWSQLVLASRY